MSAPTVTTGLATGLATTGPRSSAPWLLAHATACAEAVTSALDLLDADEVDTVPDASGEGFTLEVHADPPRTVRALHWSTEAGWTVTHDGTLRRSPRWTRLPVAADADPLDLREALCRLSAGRR
jgi:hypothetical protein